VPPCIGLPEDPDDRWKSKADKNVIPVDKPFPNTRPCLITFDAVGTLIMPSQSIGRWYRAALNMACDMSVRLPNPQLFAIAYKDAYDEM
jgi:hypothetical protein